MIGRNRGFFEVFKVDELLELITKLIETKLKLAMLDLEEKGINLIAKLLSAVMMGVLALVFVLFLSFTAAHYFNEVFVSTYLGFAAVTGFYLALLLILVFIRKKVAFKDIISKGLQNNHDKRKNGRK